MEREEGKIRQLVTNYGQPTIEGGKGTMKRSVIFALLVTLPVLGAAMTASADPRMETNNNFCHFIMDPTETDNEVFQAGCDSTIAVTIIPTQSVASAQGGREKVGCEEYANYRASGYGTVTKVMPLLASPVPVGKTLKYTNEDSSTACTMVESNGREYRSYKWESKISVFRTTPRGFVRVVYEVACEDGRM
jgi:hypothetical protein